MLLFMDVTLVFIKKLPLDKMNNRPLSVLPTFQKLLYF